jgi:hypothetical protein
LTYRKEVILSREGILTCEKSHRQHAIPNSGVKASRGYRIARDGVPPPYLRYSGPIIWLRGHLRMRRSGFRNAMAYRYSYDRVSRCPSDEISAWQSHEGAPREATTHCCGIGCAAPSSRRARQDSRSSRALAINGCTTVAGRRRPLREVWSQTVRYP